MDTLVDGRRSPGGDHARRDERSARQTGYVRGWSHGMLVAGGKFKKDKEVEKTLRERGSKR